MPEQELQLPRMSIKMKDRDSLCFVGRKGCFTRWVYSEKHKADEHNFTAIKPILFGDVTGI